MVKPIQKAEIKTFVGGLVTDAPTLEFPPNSSRTELNFTCELDGSRKRRLGFDKAAGDAFTETVLPWADQGSAPAETFIWDAPGGYSGLKLLVVQVRQTLYFYDTSAKLLGTNIYGQVTLNGAPEAVRAFAAVDGFLVCVYGEREFDVVRYQHSPRLFDRVFFGINIRDHFGVEEKADLRYDTDPNYRGVILDTYHYYNLKNQSWALGRLPDQYGTNPLQDPVGLARAADSNRLPSNSDVIWQSLYHRPVGREWQPATHSGDGSEGNPVVTVDPGGSIYLTAETFNNQLYKGAQTGSLPAAKGFFIIDAFIRGFSRRAAANRLFSNNVGSGALPGIDLSLLPEDRTWGGPTCAAAHNGRVFFSGVLDASMNDPDNRSPNYSNYVFFSQVVRGLMTIQKCYQEGDPTSREASDIVDTDGGFLKISGAVRINKLLSHGDKVLVFAENGVWAIGGSEGGFKATNYNVEKISNFGCINSRSVVVVGRSVFYWNLGAIYRLAPNQFGELEVVDISTDTLKSYFMNIHEKNKERAFGAYSPSRNRVHWIFQNDNGFNTANTETTELIYDLKNNAFYPSKISYTPLVAAKFIGMFESEGEAARFVGQPTPTGGFEVANTMKYVFLNPGAGTFAQVNFGLYQDDTHRDWRNFIGAGVPAPAHIVTGYLTGGDVSVDKQINYLVTVVRNNETKDTLRDQPGLLGQAGFDFSDDPVSMRLSNQMQLYRPRSVFTKEPGNYYNGQQVTVNKTKLRGHGRAFALRLDTDGDRDCHIHGWNLIVTGNGVP